MATTKSKGRKHSLDKLYTTEEVVNLCLSQINLQNYDCVIEPSAGNGSFSKKINNCFAYDIAPEADGIVKQDWFELDKSIFLKYENILVIGNPPFGVQNSLSIKFFNEAAKFCNTIAFILPMSFKKDSVKNRLNEYFHLTKEVDLNNSIYLLGDKKIKVNCVFQIWEKRENVREKKKHKTSTFLFDFVDKSAADFRIQRVGGNAGKAFLDINGAEASNYFLKNKTSIELNEIVETINKIKFSSIEFAVGPKSLSKTELIEEIEKYFLKVKLIT